MESHGARVSSYGGAAGGGPQLIDLERDKSYRVGFLTVSMPRELHLKCLIVDDASVVLGSGNMDRASWYTSQELGVVFESRELACRVRELVERELMQ